MKISEQWLREWANPEATTEELGQALTMAGLELDGIEGAAAALDGVVVARIDAIERHPDADKLQVCSLNIGTAELQQVVCGAANARLGLTVALATVGTILPNGVEIKAAELRGVASNGMLCSLAELALADEAEGILELASDLTLGQSLHQALALNDQIFDIDLTPNRADCLSILGVAREVSALYQVALSEMPESTVNEVAEITQLNVKVSAKDACPRYCGRVISDVDVSAETPMWMSERLRRGGIRSINVVVDVCNYVMLELGQPMHAFDLETLTPDIEVRYARDAEKLTLLDGNPISLKSDQLVIADADKALALAGIMGGLDSAVQRGSGQIFLESAFFDPIKIAGKARMFGLHTESSHRFERGVDPQLAPIALDRATALIQQLAGGHAGLKSEALDLPSMPPRHQISLDVQRAEQRLGVELTRDQVEKMFLGLHCEVQQDSATGLTVTAPSYRFDLSIEVDLIEEIARLIGYDQIPVAALATDANAILAAAKTNQSAYRLRQELAAMGYNEAVTFSFIEAEYAQVFSAEAGKALANPISTDLSTMRTSVWPGLCVAASYNLKRQQSSIRFVELGRKYLPHAQGVSHCDVVAGLVVGEAEPRQWSQTSRNLDFYDVKGDLESIFEELGVLSRIGFQSTQKQGLHPGKTLAILCDEKVIGSLGVLHPEVANQFNMSEREVIVFEFEWSAELFKAARSVFSSWSKYPTVSRDLSLLVDEELSVQSLLDVISGLDMANLIQFEVFSIYQGQGVPASQKSISLSLILQDFSATLTDKQIEESVAKIVTELQDKCNAELRN